MENESNSGIKSVASGLNKIRRIITICSLGGGIPFFIIVVIISALIVLGVFEIESNAGTGSIAQNGECGFTISTTSLSKEEYKNKITEYAKTESRAQIFAENADNIYDLAVSSNINPELVIVRADAEGYDPGGDTYNYWGLGCTNTGGEEACNTYSSFLDGVTSYINNISSYTSLINMMESYSYIGDNWIEGSSSEGGCYYYEYIKDYYDTSSEAQESKKAAEEACAAGGTGIKTTEYDQAAYANYQVNNYMYNIRKRIFGLTDTNTACSSSGSSSISVSVNELIRLSDAEVWKLLTGSFESKPSKSQFPESKMKNRTTTIEVPYRTWASSGDEVIGTIEGEKVTKKTKKLTVHTATAELFEEFFTAVYNEAENFVIRSFDGCYYYRTNTNNPKELSTHSFGVACDINANTPGNRNEDTSYTTWAEVSKNVSGKQKYEVVYKQSEIIAIAHRYTITNGSDWNNPHDAMHFSFIGDKTRKFSQELAGITP